MCFIIFGLKLSISLGSLSGWVTALLGIYSAFSVFHKSYRIVASFDIDMKNKLFNKVEINFINNGKINYITEFEGMIPSIASISYSYKSFGRKRIKDVTNQIRYDKGDSNYNSSYVKYFRKFQMIKPHATLVDNIIIPLTDIIKIVKINKTWEQSIKYELIHKRELLLTVLFKDYKKRAIPGIIKIDPNNNLYSKNTYNFMISKMFNRKTLKNILVKQDKQIKEDHDENIRVKNERRKSVKEMRIFP